MKEISGKWFLCDPEKNRECRKFHCAGGHGVTEEGCCMTTRKAYAQRDADGNAIRVHVTRKPGKRTGWEYRTETEGPPGRK